MSWGSGIPEAVVALERLGEEDRAQFRRREQVAERRTG
jgi:hypothetical protein